jgi:hypothetical protein
VVWAASLAALWVREVLVKLIEYCIEKKRLGYAAGSRLLLLQKAEKLGKKV